MRKLQTLAFAIPLATFAALAFATPAFAWHIDSSCSNSQWIVGIPNESWANGTVATFDFNQGPDATLGKGQATTAPAAATSVVVSFNNSGERLTGSRPAGCVVVVQAVPTTTAAPTTTVGSSSTLVATDDELTPVVARTIGPCFDPAVGVQDPASGLFYDPRYTTPDPARVGGFLNVGNLAWPVCAVAVDIPPVPQPQGVSAAFTQTLPVTGGGTDLLTLGAAMVLAAGLVMVLVARRRVA